MFIKEKNRRKQNWSFEIDQCVRLVIQIASVFWPYDLLKLQIKLCHIYVEWVIPQ